MNFADKLKNFFVKEYKEPDYNFLRNLPESEYERYLKEIYRARTGLKLNLKNPKRFNEKIQYLKLHDNMEAKSVYTDKAAVRDYYLEKIGSDKHLKELYGIYNSFDEIDFDKLPEQFLMQVTHSCNMLFAIKNKSQISDEGKKSLKNLFEGWMNYNFAFCAGFELQYKNIAPGILIEKLYGNDDKSQIKDIELFYCGGKLKFITTIVHGRCSKKGQIAYYDADWNVYPCGTIFVYPPQPIEKPACFDEMLKIADRLADGFKFVRVDFMLIDENFYFLELTFTPNSGFVRFKPDKYDFYFGSLLQL